MTNIFKNIRQAKTRFDNQSSGGFFDDLKTGVLSKAKNYYNSSVAPASSGGPVRDIAATAGAGAKAITKGAFEAANWIGRQGWNMGRGIRSIPELKRVIGQNKRYDEEKKPLWYGNDNGIEWRKNMIEGRDRMSEQLKKMGMSPQTLIDIPKKYPEQVQAADESKSEPSQEVFQMPDRNEEVPTPHLVPKDWELGGKVYEIFGKEADNALRVLKRENVNGGEDGENVKLETGKEVDASNEGYDDNNTLPYFKPSKELIAPGDMMGEDGLYHSMDRGLFRINNRTFFDFQNRKGDVLKELGINSYEDMLDPTKNIIFAKILFDEQGWKAWAAAPDDTLLTSNIGPFGAPDYQNPFGLV